MAFVMKETTLKDRQKIYSEDVVKKVRETGYDLGTLNLELMEKKWFVHEIENAYFCSIKVGFYKHDSDSRWRYLLIVDGENLILELKGFNNVIFLCDNDFVKQNFVKIKNLVTNGFAASGRWGDGNVDGVNAVPDPTFEFNSGAEGVK